MFRLGPWAALWFGLAFGLSSLSWTGEQQGVALLLTSAAVSSALAIATTAMVIWTLGYVVGLPRRMSSSLWVS